jgi:D-lyxose ketol-isomerase
MKRSLINAIMRDADEFIRRHHFFLPRFAYWSPEEWRHKGQEVADIVERRLGWDITDFGMERFEETGLFLFTLRNGSPEELTRGTGKLYAEKIMVVGVNQVTPMHFHWAKTEDIINRGGGNLEIRLYNATEDERLAKSAVVVSIDGARQRVNAGDTVVLAPGDSITLSPFCYHSFWGIEQPVLVGEVSVVNDDQADNRFLEQVGRFPTIDEDEPPLHLLVSDYERYYFP